MTDSKVIAVFPRRPLALKAGWRARGALSFGAFMVVAADFRPLVLTDREKAAILGMRA